MLTELHQIITKDGIPLEGLFFKPKRKSGVAALWISGLTGRFSNRPEWMLSVANVLNNRNIAFAIFDHRGQGTINFLRKKVKNRTKKVLGGTTFERFEHCVYDIDAVIRFLRKKGYKKIFLLGHSTGANKIAYYIWKVGKRGVAGIGLLGPLSDIPVLKKDLGRKYRLAIKWAEAMVKKGKRKTFMPPSFVGEAFWAAERFLSIAREGSREDTFPYYNPRRKFYWVKKIRVPTLVIIGGNEQYADRPVQEILEAFEKQIPDRFFNGKIIKGADHGFEGKEKELARTIANWIKNAK